MAGSTLNTRNVTQHAFGNSTLATIVMVNAFGGPAPANPIANNRLAIFGIIITVGAAETITIQDTTGQALSQAFNLPAGGSIVLDPMNNGDFWWESPNAGAGLQIVQSVGGTALGYDVWWNPSI